MGLKDLELFAQQESLRSAQSDTVSQSLTQGLDQNPDDYAKLLQISARTGVAPALAKDFRPELEKRVRMTELSVDQMVRTHPKTAQFLADRDNAAVSHDDTSALKTIEDTLLAVPAGLVQGWDKQRQMFLNFKEVVGNISPAERAELEKLDQISKQRSKEYSKGAPSWTKAAADVVGMSANSLLDAASEEGAIGMGTGAGTGFTLGLIGGPTAPVTATAGGATGAIVGLKAGVATGVITNTYESSVGETYDDLKNFRLPDGTKLDPNVARYASIVAGVPNTALETFALGKALKVIPFADKVIGQFGRDQIKEILVRPTMRAAMADIGTKYAVAVGTETFTEGLQKFVSILAREAAIGATPEGGKAADPDWFTKNQTYSKQAWQPTTLQTTDEVKFREWLFGTKLFNSIKGEIATERGVTPDRLPNAVVLDALDKQKDYDYRAAWKKGITEVISTQDGRPHWPSKAEDGTWLKSPSHPTSWKEFFMQETGKDPDELKLDTIDKARAWSMQQLTTPKADQRQGRAYDTNQLREDAKAIVDESTEAFKASVVLGGMGGGVKTYQARQEVKKAEQTQAVFQAIADGANDSKTNKRVPERFQEFVNQATKDGPVQNVYIGSEEFSRFFQSQGVDPEQVANEIGVTNYRAAMAAGSDIVIPMGLFASKVAPTEYLGGIMQDARLRQGDMSLREAQAYQAEQETRDAELLANMEQIVAEQQAAGGFSRAVRQIMTDMEGQLVSIGMTDQMARDEAVKLRGVAVLVERDLKERAAREGRQVSDQEVLENIHNVWDRYGLTVNREIPDVLTTAPTSDISIDPLLDSIRAGNFPSDREIFGRSLAEFIRDSGGIVATGETLTAQENMERRPFQSNLVQPNGMTLDMALAKAVSAGYFPNQNENLTEADFLNALDEDLRGNGVYSINETNNNALAIREAMNSLGEYLDTLGIDLQAITNNAGVRRLLENARRDPALEGIVNELEQFVNEYIGQQSDNTLYQRVRDQAEGTAVPESIDAVANVESAFEFAATQSFPTNRDFKVALQERVNQAAKDANVNLEEFSKATEEYLVRLATADGITAMRTNANAVGWYNEKVTKALRLVSLIHPEVSTDPQAKFAFVWAMAVTSNGLKVDKNFELAEQAYEKWKASGGVMPTDIGIGTAAGAINKSMGLYNTLMQKHGFEVVEQFMTTIQSAGEVQKFTGQKINGENLTTQVYGAAALGPKIGNGFFMNLYGYFDQLTMDRWLMRTWGRWTGTLVEINQAQIKSKRNQLKDVIKALSPADKKAFEAIIKRKLTVSDIDEVGVAIWKASQKPANRVEMAKIGLFDEAGAAKITEIMGEAKKGTERVSYGDELRKVGNALTKYLDGQKEAPSGPPERGNIRKVFGRVLTELQKQYPALTMSDYQALLWYPEKRLYDAAKTADEATDGYEDNEAPDYANAAAKLARAKGISDADIAAEIAAVDAELQASNGTAGVRSGARGSEVGGSDQGTTLYQSVSAPAPAFYSQLARAVEGAKQTKAPASDWLAIISKLPSVKAEEIEWTGLKDYLELRGKEQVTKEEISGYLAQNGVQVNEVFYGELTDRERFAEAQRIALDEYGVEYGELDGDDQTSVDESVDANNSQYGEYTLAGGKNYRELLLTLPVQMSAKDTERMMYLEAKRRRMSQPSQWVFDDDVEGKELVELQAKAKVDVYRNRHWSEENVLAHIRFNERTDAEGNRVLFIEEVQSDWGQEGKKRGFKGGVAEAQAALKQFTDEMVAKYGIDGMAAGKDTPEEQAEFARLSNAVASAKNGLPAAPFVGDTKGWLNLALKRMVRYAAENGFDKVAFVNGKQSAERYSLSKAVNDLSWSDRKDGGRLVMMALTDNTPVQLTVDKDANVTKAKNLSMAEGKPLEEVVGKELATKIMTEQGGDLVGVELDVGGEGMKAFYDKIVPNAVSSLIKKMGGEKLETVRFVDGGKFTIIDSKSGKEVGQYETLDEANSFMRQAKSFQSREGAQTWFDANDLQHKLNDKRMEQVGFTVTDQMRDMAMQGQALFQGEGDKRGYIQFNQQRKFNITLLEKANASTVTHELGHFYLEVLGDLATAQGAGESITKDYQTILGFLGATSREDLTLDGKAKGSPEYNRAVEMHEKFARANEAYWLEGKAPTPELQGVFQRFKNFLKLVYDSVKALNVQLNDDVRAVFDRIYATDAEIEAAKEQVNVDPIFLTAADAGMSEQEFALYREGVAKTTESGKEALLAKLMREMQRERKAWWKEEREKMKAEVTKEVDDQPVYRAFASLLAGKVDDDTPVKLNKQALIDRYGADYVKKLPRSFGRIYTPSGGMDADTAAEMLGYESGDSLIEALVGMRDRKDLIEAETDQRMLNKHGDMLNDGSLADEAKISLHNNQREDMLMSELRALRRKQREVAPFVNQAMNAQRQQARAATDVPPVEAFRRAAQGIVDQTAARDLSPYGYLQASRRAAKQAFAAMAKGDYQVAADNKQKELLNHFLYLEATKAREEADKILTYARKFEKGTTRQQMGKAGADYLDQIDAILDRYEFRRVPLRQLDRRQSLNDWINGQVAAGNEPSIPQELLDESRAVNYRQIPMSELRAIRDAVRNIEHLARYKNKLVAKRADIAFDDAIAELVASAENMTAGKGDRAVGERRPLPLDPNTVGFVGRAGDTVQRLDAMLLKMEQVVEWLDNGNINGAWHTYLWNPIAEAQTREYDITRQLTEKLASSLEKMPKAQRTSMLDTYEIAGMGKVTRKFLISVALNMGAQSNIDKMMRGMGWNMATIESGLSNLNDADWTFVQETWDTINTLWPEIAALEKRMTGLEPPKVDAQPYQVRDQNGNVIRTLAGGYYPLVYDPRKSEQGAKQEGGNLGQLFEEGYVRATTPKGHTQARMEGFAAPILFDFEQVVTQHMAKVVKDLTHREAVVQANKILTNSQIRNVLQETLGEHYEKQFLPWLRSVVNDRNGGSTQGVGDFSRWMMSARANVVAATMGFKATTMIAQITGISQSLDKVGGRYLGQALLEYMRHPIALTREVREKSGEMRNRSNTLDRDIRDQLRTLTGQTSAWAQAQKFAFHGIAIADAMVTVPTWMGAYRQAKAGGADEATAILEADSAVRMTQGAGGAKDLAGIQRNNELAKALTMFYSYFSVLYARQRDMGRDVQQIRDMPRFLSRVFFTIMFPAVMGELILGRGPDEDEDPAEWAIRKVLLYPLMTLPVLRDVVSSIDSGYDYRFSPMASLFEKIVKAAEATGKIITEDDVEWGDYAAKVADTIGYVFGVAGTAQISSTGKYLWRVSEGEEQPDNLAELLAYALLGKRKKD